MENAKYIIIIDEPILRKAAISMGKLKIIANDVTKIWEIRILISAVSIFLLRVLALAINFLEFFSNYNNFEGHNQSNRRKKNNGTKEITKCSTK